MIPKVGYSRCERMCSILIFFGPTANKGVSDFAPPSVPLQPSLIPVTADKPPGEGSFFLLPLDAELGTHLTQGGRKLARSAVLPCNIEVILDSRLRGNDIKSVSRHTREGGYPEN